MTRKFTSEDLLKSMGLKQNDMIKMENGDIFKVVLTPMHINHDGETYTKGIYELEFKNSEIRMNIMILLNNNFEIIQPNPILSEDEMIIVRSLPSYCNKYLVRDINNDISCCGGKPIKQENVWILDDGYRCFIPYEHLFQFIKPMECYSREELLGESV